MALLRHAGARGQQPHTQIAPIETRRTYFLVPSGKFDGFQVVGKNVET